MIFKLSEYGKHTLFNTLLKAVKYCKENNFLDGENGRLWLMDNNKRKATAWLKLNNRKIDHQYMILAYTHGKKIFIWNEDEEKWCESEKYWAICKMVGEELFNIAENLK